MTDCAELWPPTRAELELGPEPVAPTPGTATLDTLVTDLDGTPLPGLVVELREVEGEGFVRVTADERGEHRFEDLPAGELELAVLVDGQVQASRRVILTEGAHAYAYLRLGGLGEGREVVEPSNLPADAILRMDRSACLGNCPSFSIVVFEDGRWAWDGGVHVRVEGRHGGQLSAAELERIQRVEQCLSQVPTYDWFSILDVSKLTLLVRDRDADQVVRLHARARDQTPPAVLAAVDELARVLPIRRMVGRKWRW